MASRLGRAQESAGEPQMLAAVGGALRGKGGIHADVLGWEHPQPSTAPRSASSRSPGRPLGPARPEARASEAPREEFQPFPLRRAVCSPLAARPQRGPRWGPGGAGQSPAASGSCLSFAVQLGIPGPPPLVPGDQTGLPSSPGPAWRPRAPTPPRAAAAGTVPAPCARPRPLRTPGSPQITSLKQKLALATSSWGKSLSLSKPQFLLLWNGRSNNSATHLYCPGLNEKRNVLDKSQ